MSSRLSDYISDFKPIFKNKTKVFFDKAENYTQGIIKSEMHNIERISEELGTHYHQMQHFITESNWKGRDVIDKVAKEVSLSLPKTKLTGLIIDESGWVKKGERSVGVGHQYCGNVGKTANSQVAVFACLNNGDFASMVDVRLYLPKDWCEDADRCKQAGIPKDQRTFKTKLKLAEEIVQHQINQGVSFDFVSADGYYGNDTNFANLIAKNGFLYMLDIHADQTIYLDRPELKIPERKSLKGKEPKNIKATTPSISVNKYMQTLENKDWKTLSVRNTTKGVLKGEYHFKKAFIWNKNSDEIESRMLVIRKTKSTKKSIEIKYSFTNASLEDYTPETLAYMQAQRFFVEHCIKESKQILGIDQFQTRMWNAWEHQVALNFMVSSFMLKEKLFCFDDLPLLSARDIKEYLTFKLFKEMTEDDIIDKMFNRHLIRQKDINYSFSKSKIC